MKKLLRFLPHLSISLCLGVVVLTILDGFNPMMSFLTSQPSKIFIFCSCAAGLASALECTACQNKLRRRRRTLAADDPGREQTGKSAPENASE